MSDVSVLSPFSNLTYLEELDSMFMHFAVPDTSSSAIPSTPTSLFCGFYVGQFYANYKCSIHTFGPQRETRKVSFHISLPISIDWERNERNS